MQLKYSIRGTNLIIELHQDTAMTVIIPIPKPFNPPPRTAYNSTALFWKNEPEFSQQITIAELKSDLTDLMPSYTDDKMHEDMAIKLQKLILSHIQKFGRLLPNDLETYIAEQHLILDAIRIAQKLQIDKKAKQQHFADTYNFILEMLPDEFKAGHRMM